MRTLYIAWQDPEARDWFPVGRLTFDGEVYRFVYTQGAKQSPNFLPFGRMTELDAVYESVELFPLFANRLLPVTRPEYRKFLDWLNVQEHEADPIALLSRSEGLRETDSLTVFPCPEKDAEGKLQIHFFSHGIRYLEDRAIQLIKNLDQGQRLYLMPDPLNPHHRYAIALRTSDPATIVGYCPRYLARDFLYMLSETSPDDIELTVERVNREAPIQLRLLCKLSARWPQDFEPCSDELYQPLAS